MRNEKRIERSLECAGALGAGALMVTSKQNARYLSGFAGSNVTLFVTPNRRLLLTDQRYADQAKQESPGWEIEVHGPNRNDAVSGILSLFSGEVFAYEDTSLTVAEFSSLSDIAAIETWIPLQDELLFLRSVKDEEEIDLIRKSQAIAETGFANSAKTMVPGTKEAEVSAEIEFHMARAGSENPSFPTIVAAGEHSAYPHARPGENRLGDDDLATIDWGAVFSGYRSDLTRVVRLGEPDPRHSRLLSMTMAAFDSAMESIRPGVTGDHVDAAARSVFEEHGVEKWSLRGLGHGVGLDIHEKPRIVVDSKEVLAPGMVFTIEPGLYVPGVGGVRVEHTVLLTDSGPEVLSEKLPLVIEDGWS